MYGGNPDIAHPSGGGRISGRRLVYIAAAAAVVVLIAALLIALPYVIKAAVEKRLVHMGAESAEVGDVDFNPFTGALRVEDVRVFSRGATSLRLEEASFNLSLVPLFSRRLLLGEVEVAGLDMEVARTEGRPLDLGGLGLKGPEEGGEGAKENAKAWGVGFTALRVAGSRVGYREAGGAGGDVIELSFAIDELSTTAVESWSPAMPVKMTMRGSVNGGPISVEAEGVLSAAGGEEGEGGGPSPSIEARVDLKGLPLSVLDGLTGPRADLQEGTVGADVTLTLGPTEGVGGGFLLIAGGDVMVDGVRIKTPRSTVGSKGIALEGEARFGGKRGEGKVPPIDLRGNARITGLDVEGPGGKLSVFGFASAGVDDLSYRSAGPVDIGLVAVKDLYSERLISGQGPQDTLIAAVRLTARGVSLNGLKRVEAESVLVSDLTVNLERGGDGGWRIIDEIKAASAIRREEKAELSGLVVSVDDFSVTGPSVVSFRDLSVEPLYEAEISIETLTLGPSGKMNEGGEGPRSLTFAALVNKYAELKAAGTVEPFTERPTLDLSGTVRALDLPPLGPYAVANLGYNLTSGHMDADFDVKIDEGALEGRASVTLDGLEVDPVDGGVVSEFARELTMPLDAAMRLLRDRDGSIKFDVPVTGDILGPKFSLAGVMNKALGRAVKKSAVAYLKYAFQPYGSFITVANLAMYLGESVFGIRLDPVVFAPAEVTLDDRAMEYLAKVAEVMDARAGVSLKVCGFAVPGEAAGAEPDATAPVTLARRRAEAVKDHLVEVYGIGGDRLFLCSPEIDDREGAAPRVELLI